jgi:alpha-1,2-mannosyltransferase
MFALRLRMAIGANPDRWLTVKRLRAHGTILALCLWSLYVWNLATPSLRDRNGNLKGTDFLHFYTLGSLAVAHRGVDLYDMNEQAVVAAQRVPEAAGIRYLPLYPPQVSILFAPLAHFSYGWALVWWWGCSASLYGICCYAVWRVCPNLRHHGGTVILLAAAFPAFFHLIAWGQTSALALACFALMFFLLRDRREFVAGLVLGCLIFKPQLGLASAVVFLSIGAWRILLGAALSAAAQLSAGIFYYGMEPLRHWIRLLRNAGAVMPLLEPKPYQTYSLRTFWNMLVPWPDLAFGLYVLSGVVLLGLTIACWKRGQSVPLALRYSALLLATVLVAPHLTVYDLVILAPAFLLLSDWLIGQKAAQGAGDSTFGLGTLLYLSYTLPLLGPFARFTHVQLSVVAMAGTVYVIWRVCLGRNLFRRFGRSATAPQET